MALLAVPATAGAHGVACGATITSSTKLRADLDRLPGRRAGRRRGQHHARPRPAHDRRERAGVGIRLAGRRGVKIIGRHGAGVRDPASASTAPTATASSGVARARPAPGAAIDVLNGSDGNVVRAADRSTGNRTGITRHGLAGNVDPAQRRSRATRSRACCCSARRATASSGNRVADNVRQRRRRRRGLRRTTRSPRNAIEGGEAGLIVDTADRNLRGAQPRRRRRRRGASWPATRTRSPATSSTRAEGGCEGCFGCGIGVLSGHRQRRSRPTWCHALGGRRDQRRRGGRGSGSTSRCATARSGSTPCRRRPTAAATARSATRRRAVRGVRCRSRAGLREARTARPNASAISS